MLQINASSREMPGQGATEYLVLLAVVLIVALVSVSLLGFFPGMSNDAQLTQSQAYWSGTARPFAVLEAASTYNTLCQTANKGGYLFVIQNSEASSLTITGLKVDSSSFFCQSGGVANASVPIGPGERKTFSVATTTLSSPCTAGKVTQMDLNITYSTAFITNKTQSGSKKMMLRCSTSLPSVCLTLGAACGGGIPEPCCGGLGCNENVCE